MEHGSRRTLSPRARGASRRAAERKLGGRPEAAAAARGTDSRRVDRLATLGTLVAEIVHEVRNPLVSVQTFLELLPERVGDADFLQGFHAVALDELARIGRLLDDLLVYAGPERPRGAPATGADAARAVALVERLLAHRADASGVGLETDVPPALPSCAIGSDALRQVLLNLALNALDATPPGGDVRIAARSLGPALEFDIEDRGPGIPGELRRRVFEPFFSTRPDRPGGLGLAIARRLVVEAGGTLAVRERRGGGSRFRLRLPASA